MKPQPVPVIKSPLARVSPIVLLRLLMKKKLGKADQFVKLERQDRFYMYKIYSCATVLG